MTGNFLMFLIFIFGYMGLQSLRSTFFPETESRNILVQAVYPGASPQEIEEGIVLKIEDNLKGLSGIEEVTSVSSENVATITVTIDKGENIDAKLQDVKNAADRVSSYPGNMEPLVIYKRENIAEAISFSLSGTNDLHVLKKYARKVEDDIRGIEGISQIELGGFPDEEIEIAFRENDMRAYGITFTEAVNAIRKSNLDITGGSIKGAAEEQIIRARTKKYYASEMLQIVIKANSEGNIVRLEDIADVKDQWADVPTRSYLDNEMAVTVSVSNTITEDILYITETIRNYVKDFNENNTEVQATIVLDKTTALNQRIDLLLDNGTIGFLLVLVFLTMFLNMRLSFWVAISIPISFAGMFILANYAGITINVMSLFGMIVVIGILVDDGIVISENIFQHVEKGKRPLRAAIDGTIEVLPAVTAGVLTTIIAFSSFFFIDGRLGDFAWELGFVVMATLAFSLIEGAFILPAHIGHSKALKKGHTPSKVERWFDGIMKGLRDRFYAPVLRFSLQNKLFVLFTSIALLLITNGAMKGGIIRGTFFPEIENDFLNINLKMPSGTRDYITKGWIDKIGDAADEVNKELTAKRTDDKLVFEHIKKTTGPGTNEATIRIILLNSEDRQLSVYPIAEAIRKKMGPVDQAESLTYEIGGPFGKPVSLALLSSNLNELDAAKRELKDSLRLLSSIKDVTDNNQDGTKEINLTLKEKAYLLGMSIQDITSQVRQGFFGGEVQRLQRGLDEVKVWVRYAEEDRSSLGNLENMRIRTANGQSYPLRELADFSIKRGIQRINHRDGQREVKIEADVASTDVSASEVMSGINSDLLPKILAKYPSVKTSIQGQGRQSAKTMKSLGVVLPIILLLMFAVIAYTFRSLPQAATVFLLIPFAFIGIGWGHYIHGKPISLLSFFGIIALIGVMVNDSLVLISAMNISLKNGKKFIPALYDAAKSRFRPIVLTSVTTIAGLAPLILEKSMQAQFLIPMAIAIAYGLMIATFLTLILLPVLLGLINDIRLGLYQLWNGETVERHELEPAVIELSAEKRIDDEEND